MTSQIAEKVTKKHSRQVLNHNLKKLKATKRPSQKSQKTKRTGFGKPVKKLDRKIVKKKSNCELKPCTKITIGKAKFCSKTVYSHCSNISKKEFHVTKFVFCPTSFFGVIKISTPLRHVRSFRKKSK